LANDDSDRTQTHIVLAPGTLVSHYKIVDKIGAGGMGEVYLADDTKLDRKVALKFMPIHLAADSEMRQRFTREAQAAARLDHPNIVTIYEVGEFNGRPFFAMQFIEGETLNKLRRDESLSIQKIINLMSQIASGLAKAHAMGITHRDIKSANIIVNRDSRAKILDFGLATLQGSEMLTKTGSTLGTVAYMSPEQVQGSQVDHRSDIFSLGVVMYELITGQPPFKKSNDAATLHSIVSENPAPLSQHNPSIPPELERLINKVLAKNPNDRYQTATEIVGDLNSVSQSLSSPGQSSGSVAASQPSVAVLPFNNMSSDPDNEFFSDGLTEELLNVLAKNPGLKVTGRTSSFAFKGKTEDLRVIGQKLGVESLLEGSVRKAGNRVRITAQLVKAVDGFHLWSETYDRVVDDIFAVQDEIAGAVAKELHVKLLGSSGNKHTVNPESYQLTLKANQLAHNYTKADVQKAKEMYEQALKLDESNVPAIAGLANVWLIQAAYGLGTQDLLGEYRRGKELAKRAIEADSELPEPYISLAWVRVAFENNYDDAMQNLMKAYRLAPNNVDALGFLGLLASLRGDFDAGKPYFKKALELDPLNPETLMNYGKTLLWASKFTEAEEIFLKALELSPGMATIHLNLGWVRLLRGQPDEALVEMEKEPGSGYRLCGLATIYHALGRADEAKACLDELIDSHRESWCIQIAMVYGYMGEVDKAFEWIDRSIVSRDAGVPLLRVSPFMTSLHDDPRWPALLRKIGLAD